MLLLYTMKNLIIIGSGPAGYTASIYANRYGISNVLIGDKPGGMIADAHKVCNFPGEKEITGQKLAQKIREHTLAEGCREIFEKVVSVEKKNNLFEVETGDGEKRKAQAVLIATGSKRRRLGLDQEKKFLGKGVSYCATCDGPLFKDEVVAVIGGGNAAHTASLLLSEIAERVYEIYRGDKLKGTKAWAEKIKKDPKIEIIYNTNVIGLAGEKMLEEIELDSSYQGKDNLKVKGLFIEIGSVPQSKLAKKAGVKTNKKGYIKVKEDQSTNVSGIYAAGDVTNGSAGFRQVVTACSESAVAVRSIFSYLKNDYEEFL